MEAELVLDAKARLGEGPCWDEREKRLLFVDIESGLVHFYDPATGKDRAIAVGQMVGCAVPRIRGGLMLAVQQGFASLDTETEAMIVLARPEAHLPQNRMNDGKCDPVGRFFAGTMALTCTPGGGSLYRMDPGYAVKRMIEGVTISNGLAWSPDGKTLYYIDTGTNAVAAFDYDLATGTLSGRRVAVQVPRELGHPDGMTIDEEGMLWVGHWEGWSVCRWDPASSRLLERVAMPVARTTACAFGGPDLADLYITTAWTGLSEAQKREQPLAGGLFRWRPGVRGMPAAAFAG